MERWGSSGVWSCVSGVSLVRLFEHGALGLALGWSVVLDLFLGGPPGVGNQRSGGPLGFLVIHELGSGNELSY